MRQRIRYITGLLLLAVLLITGCGAPPQSAGGGETASSAGEAQQEEWEEQDRPGQAERDAENADTVGLEADRSDSADSRSDPADADRDETGRTDAGEALTENTDSAAEIREDGAYTTKEEVAAYLNQYGHLPDNFITKTEAKKLGWASSKGNLSEVAPGKSIGGDRFGNYEGSLPEKKGRKYYECDINADGGYRGAERIIFSNDGLVYYTGDHYNTFELLYGEE